MKHLLVAKVALCKYLPDATVVCIWVLLIHKNEIVFPDKKKRCYFISTSPFL